MAAKKTVTAVPTVPAVDTVTAVPAKKTVTAVPAKKTVPAVPAVDTVPAVPAVYIGKPVDLATVPILPLPVAIPQKTINPNPMTRSAVPATDQAVKNVMIGLGIERCEIPEFIYKKRTYNYALQAVYKSVSSGTASRKMIEKYTIIDSSKDRVEITLYPDPKVGFNLQLRSDSMDPGLVRAIMKTVLSVGWLMGEVSNGNIRPHIIMCSLTFGLVNYANGDDYLGSADPISDDDAARVMQDYQVALETIAGYQLAASADRPRLTQAA